MSATHSRPPPASKPSDPHPALAVDLITSTRSADLVQREADLSANYDRRGQTPPARLSDMFGYIGDLRTMTSGRGQYSMEFSHYAPCPRNVSEVVIAEAKAREEARQKAKK